MRNKIIISIFFSIALLFWIFSYITNIDIPTAQDAKLCNEFGNKIIDVIKKDYPDIKILWKASKRKMTIFIFGLETENSWEFIKQTCLKIKDQIKLNKLITLKFNKGLDTQKEILLKEIFIE
jgi:hypothetical protein